MAATRIRAGVVLTPRELNAVSGAVPVPYPERTVHLQFRRYANCPICSLHLRSFAARHEQISAAGVHEVVVFHSTAEDIAKYKAGLPFDVVPDPKRTLYIDFGVERSVRAVLHPSSWLATLRGWSPPLGVRAGVGGHLGLPADFLIGPDGRVLAAKYGTHANDQWSVDDVLTLVRATRAT
ncbi:MAG: peroxiredoxin-like family protein [Micromonosporaceae bacterium]